MLHYSKLGFPVGFPIGCFVSIGFPIGFLGLLPCPRQDINGFDEGEVGLLFRLVSLRLQFYRTTLASQSVSCFVA